MIKVNIRECIDTVVDAILNVGPSRFIILGPPGVGKTSVMRKISELINHRLWMQSALGLSPDTVYGLMALVDGKTIQTRPPLLPPEDDVLQGKDGLLAVIDEFTALKREMHDALLGPFSYEGQIGSSYFYPKPTSIVLVGNDSECGATFNDPPEPFKSRFTWIFVRPDVEQAVTDYMIPNGWHIYTRAFLKTNVEHFYLSPDKAGDTAFPCPRSWEVADKYLRKISDENRKWRLIEGTLGETTTQKFRTWIAMIPKVIPLSSIINHPDSAVLPSHPEAVCFVSLMLSNNLSKDTLSPMWRYVKRLRDANGPEWPLIFKKAVEDKKLTESAEYLEMAGL